MKLVYLAGAITGNAIDARAWREEADAIINPHGIGDWRTVDPMKLEVSIHKPEELVRTDYAELLKCDLVLAKVDRPSWGTAMELAFAKQHRIPVVAFAPSTTLLSPWLRYHVDFECHNLDEAIDTIFKVF